MKGGGSDPKKRVQNMINSTFTKTRSLRSFLPGSAADKSDQILNVDSLIARLVEQRRKQVVTTVNMYEWELHTLVTKCRVIFHSQPLALELGAPIKIIGDIHGQYQDLLRLFSYAGYPPDGNYLFLGDYVDRGKMSLESICLLLCYKLKYPENFFMLRGNHETEQINRIYGFYDECKRRFSVRLYRTFQDMFNCMPCSAMIDDRVICMHGGISRFINTYEDILACDERPMLVNDEGIVCDLLWADPDKDITGFQASARGVSYLFGCDEVDNFCAKLNVDLICRAHQVVEDGYEFFRNKKLVTIFSAPNYCGSFHNAGGIMSINENLECSFQILRPRKRLNFEHSLRSRRVDF